MKVGTLLVNFWPSRAEQAVNTIYASVPACPDPAISSYSFQSVRRSVYFSTPVSLASASKFPSVLIDSPWFACVPFRDVSGQDGALFTTRVTNVKVDIPGRFIAHMHRVCAHRLATNLAIQPTMGLVRMCVCVCVKWGRRETEGIDRYFAVWQSQRSLWTTC